MFTSWFSNMENYFWQKGADTATFFERIFLSKRLLQENEQLETENQSLTLIIIQLENAQSENEELRKILNLELPKDFQFIDAYIFSKDSQNDSVYINKGEKDNIKVGAAVINAEGMLIGRVSKINERNSLIYLITSPQIKTNVEIGENRIEGIVKGKGNFEMNIENLPKDKEIKEGDLVITGRIQNDFPSGLPLGTVKSVKITDLDPFQQIVVEPFLKINDLGFVLVISE